MPYNELVYAEAEARSLRMTPCYTLALTTYLQLKHGRNNYFFREGIFL